jgi:iron(III) transport system permease protein
MIERPWSRIASNVLLLAALTAVLGWPAVATVIDAVRGEENPGGGSMTPIEGGATVRPWRVAGETIRLVATTEALALPVGIALAILLFRTDLPGRKFWLALLALETLVPMPLHATGWLGGFGNLGRSQVLGTGPILVGRFGAAFVHATAALPWIVWIVGLGLLAVEPELEESAVLEMAPWRVALSVTLRRSLGAIAGAALAVAVLTAGDMTVTDLLSIRTYAEESYIQIAIRRGPATVALTALPPLIVLGGLIVVAAAWLLRSDPSRIVSTATLAPPWRLGKWRIVAGLMLGIFLAAFVGLPLYSLLWRAGRVGGNARLGIAPHWSMPGLIGTLRASFSDVLGSNPRRPLRGPLAASLLWGSVGAAGSVALAWSLAWASRKPGPWRWITAVAVAVALATPGPVAGMAMVLAYRSVDRIYDSPAIVVLTYIMRTWPYALLLLWPAVRGLPGEYFETAELEGCGPFDQVRRIALPLTLATIGLAWGAASVLAFGELPATTIVLPPGHTTLTKRIWDLLHIGVESRLAGIALVTLAFFALSGLAVVVGFGWLAAHNSARSGR